MAPAASGNASTGRCLLSIRTLVVEYLEQCGISADDDTFYGDGILVQQRVTYATRTESLEQAKARIAGGGR